ncbi:MAG: hypothetical protein A3J38_02955 [Gammaproteobacteria bacterium RIFCSPHIGHO2_12_FULL_45_9]|nr:MAG: hypothetical protein A3J38_02955 [Gammaproteobacteria bacterium RIFCSPHIGHO2_12_FULL_45_9]
MKTLIWTTRRYAAFSLVEVLMTLALCTLLLTVTLPVYHAHMRTTHRQQTLLTLAQAVNQLQMNYHLDHTYTQTSLDNLHLTPTAHASYRFQLLTDDHHFQLQAIPQGTQTGDACGTLSVDETNRVRSIQTCELGL